MGNVTGTNNGETLVGTNDADVITALGGNDTIDGLAGADVMEGGIGDDVFYVDDLGDQVVELGGEGTDEVRSGISLTLSAHVENLVLTGTGAISGTGNGLNNRITGNDAANVISGGGGSDTFVGGGGDDLYIVEAEVTVGSDGGYAFGGVDQVVEAAGGGIDTVRTNVGGSLAAEVENMEVTGDLNVAVFGNGLDNRIIGNAGRNLIQAGDGNDYIDGGAGADSMNGGEGDDTYVIDDANDNIMEAPDGGVDTVISSIDHQLDFSVENLTLTGAAVEGFGNFRDNVIIGNDAANRLFGDGGNDVIDGGAGADSIDGSFGNDRLDGGTGSDADDLDGGAGDDWLLGQGGDDLLNGGFGVDRLEGGLGNDVYIVDNAGDLAVEDAGTDQTFDAVLASVSYALAAATSVEWLSTTNTAGTAAINLTGNEIVNHLIGNNGANTLSGGGGADFMTGFAGNDIYVVDDARDVIVENAGEGFDAILTGVSYTPAAGVSVEWLSTTNTGGTAAINLTGNGIVNHLIGNNGANTLSGGGGADFMTGFAGNDIYVADNAGDVVVEKAGEGFDAILTDVSYALAGGTSVEWLSTTDTGGTGAIDLTGNEIVNHLVGNNGANILDGGAGADVMTGFAGADNFAFTTALGAGNVDTIADFNAADDTIRLDDAVFSQVGPLGTLDAGAFVTGTAAADGTDRIIYDSATGRLFYDADGNGAGAQVHFATLATGLSLTASDFMVI